MFDQGLSALIETPDRLMLTVGVILGLTLIGSALLNPERRGTRWFMYLALVAAVFLFVGSWRVEDPRILSIKTQAALVPALQAAAARDDNRVRSLENEAESLKSEIRHLQGQVGAERSKSAAALKDLEDQLRALADTIGQFDTTIEGISRFTLPDNDLQFELGKAELTCETKETLAKLVGFVILKSNLQYRNRLQELVFVGHTDNTTRSDPDRKQKNLKLSEDRARAVAEYLRSQHVTIPMKIVGKGMMSPKDAPPNTDLSEAQVDAMNKDERQAAQNRRVEVLFVYEGGR